MPARVSRKRPSSKVKLSLEPSKSALTAKKIFIVLIFLMAQFLFYYSDFFRIKEIRILGNSRVSDNLIIQTANIPLDHNVLTLPLKQFRDRLTSIHWIKEVKIERVLPGQIFIHVHERVPVVLARENGTPDTWYAVDEQGVALYKANQKDRSGFPRLVVDDAIEVGKTIPPEKVKAAKEMDSWISSNLKKNVDYFLVDNQEEVVIEAHREGAPLKIKVGKLENMAHKMDVLGAFLELIEERKAKVKYIDIRSNYPVMMPEGPEEAKKAPDNDKNKNGKPEKEEKSEDKD